MDRKLCITMDYQMQAAYAGSLAQYCRTSIPSLDVTPLSRDGDPP
jgi:hypothetical protein